MKKKREHALLSAAVISVPAFLLLLIYIKRMEAAHALHLTGIYICLLPVAVIDFRHKVIPNKLLPAYIVIALLFGIYRVVSGSATMSVVSDMAAGMLMGGGVFGLAALLTKGGVGMGDVKLFIVLGLALGFIHCFYLILYTLVCAALYGLIMIFAGKASMKTRVAVGPYVLLGLVLHSFLY